MLNYYCSDMTYDTLMHSAKLYIFKKICSYTFICSKITLIFINTKSLFHYKYITILFQRKYRIVNMLSRTDFEYYHQTLIF